MNIAPDRIAALSAELGSVGGLKRLRTEVERIARELAGARQHSLRELHELKQCFEIIGALLLNLHRAVAAHLRAMGAERVNVG